MFFILLMGTGLAYSICYILHRVICTNFFQSPSKASPSCLEIPNGVPLLYKLLVRQWHLLDTVQVGRILGGRERLPIYLLRNNRQKES